MTCLEGPDTKHCVDQNQNSKNFLTYLSHVSKKGVELLIWSINESQAVYWLEY